MKNFQVQNVGNFSDLNQYVFAPEGTPISLEGKLFLGDLLGLSSMEISLNKNSAGTGMNFFHRHLTHEEVYIFINGKGEMMIDDEILEVKEGSIVKIKPEAKRSWWNTGDTDLTYLVLQAPEGGMKSPGIEDGELLEGKVPWVKN
ncbi:MAG: cupin domain-containing protein [Thiohalomonadales bacterium]